MHSGLSGGIHQYSNGAEGAFSEFPKTCPSLPCLTFLASKESLYGKSVILADRDMVETQSDEILRDADKENVCLLVVGDPLGCAHLYLIQHIRWNDRDPT